MRWIFWYLTLIRFNFFSQFRYFYWNKKNCKRTDFPFRFVYATLIREPIKRFLSEYLHNLRGATWLSERLSCQRAQQYRNQSSCWQSTTILLFNIKHLIIFLESNLTDYIFCPFNSAINRQTRMLSSLKINCLSSKLNYSDLIHLESAKRNLQSMEFFGLTEYLELSQRLFERTYICQFYSTCSFEFYLQQDLVNNQTEHFLRENLTDNELTLIQQINSDDIQLYEFAKKLFFERTCRILGIACQ